MRRTDQGLKPLKLYLVNYLRYFVSLAGSWITGSLMHWEQRHDSYIIAFRQDGLLQEISVFALEDFDGLADAHSRYKG